MALLVEIAIRARTRKRKLQWIVACGAVLTVSYVLLRPSNDREWQDDTAVAARCSVEGDQVTIRGVRNFAYRSVDDYDIRWEDRTYDLSKLETLDLFMSYWGPVAYCHTILSFGFSDGKRLAASIEVRKEIGEEFSTYGGFFKMFELSYVFADERDLIGLRTNHRKEDVYLYRLRAEPGRLREVFLSYLRFADELAEKPQFYDVIRNSCGVNILQRIAESGEVPWGAKEALLNGYWDQSMYRRGAINRELSFSELRKVSHINARAEKDGVSENFSEAIRVGLPPAPPPRSQESTPDSSGN